MNNREIAFSLSSSLTYQLERRYKSYRERPAPAIPLAPELCAKLTNRRYDNPTVSDDAQGFFLAGSTVVQELTKSIADEYSFDVNYPLFNHFDPSVRIGDSIIGHLFGMPVVQCTLLEPLSFGFIYIEGQYIVVARFIEVEPYVKS